MVTILDYEKISKIIHFDATYLHFTEDFFNKGDIISTGSYKFKITKTYRKIWWRVFLLNIGINVRMNSNGIVIYKVKPIK